MDELRLIGEADRGALEALLAPDPGKNIYLLGVLDEFGLGGAGRAHAFYGSPATGALRAVLLVTQTGLWVPEAADPRDVRAFGAGLRTLPLLTSVGDRSLVDELWIARTGGRRPRLARIQRLLQLTAEEMGPWVTPQLRLAREEELPALVEASAQMQLEDLGVDPRSIDEQGHARRCLERIRQSRTWLVADGGQILFKADVGATSRHGAQIEGVFTARSCRRQGVATKALGQLSRTLLSSLPRLTLHVDERNEAALGLYRKLGFAQHREFRLLLAE